MIKRNLSNKQFTDEQAISKVKYGDIEEGDVVNLIEFVVSGTGTCNYYKVVPLRSTKVHYMLTAEIKV